MHHNSIVDSWIAFVAGIIGGGIHLLAVTFDFWAFISALFTAFFCGAAGVAGKHMINYAVKKWKYKRGIK